MLVSAFADLLRLINGNRISVFGYQSGLMNDASISVNRCVWGPDGLMLGMLICNSRSKLYLNLCYSWAPSFIHIPFKIFQVLLFRNTSFRSIHTMFLLGN